MDVSNISSPLGDGIEVAVGPLSLLVRFDDEGIVAAAWYHDDSADELEPVLAAVVGRA